MRKVMMLMILLVMVSCSTTSYYAIDIKDEKGVRNYIDVTDGVYYNFKGTFTAVDELGDTIKIIINDTKIVEHE